MYKKERTIYELNDWQYWALIVPLWIIFLFATIYLYKPIGLILFGLSIIYTLIIARYI